MEYKSKITQLLSGEVETITLTKQEYENIRIDIKKTTFNKNEWLMLFLMMKALVNKTDENDLTYSIESKIHLFGGYK